MAGLLTCPDFWSPSRLLENKQWLYDQKHTIPRRDRVYSSGNCPGFSPDSQLSRVAPIHHKHKHILDNIFSVQAKLSMKFKEDSCFCPNGSMFKQPKLFLRNGVFYKLSKYLYHIQIGKSGFLECNHILRNCDKYLIFCLMSNVLLKCKLLIAAQQTLTSIQNQK